MFFNRLFGLCILNITSELIKFKSYILLYFFLIFISSVLSSFVFLLLGSFGILKYLFFSLSLTYTF